MRIISGKARGSKLFTLEGLETRPTTDRVKESLFNLLQYEFYNKHILDLFAGSGALGLEGISRGGASLTAVDQNKACVEIIKKNAEKTHATDVTKVIQGDCNGAIRRLPAESIDIVFMDPPYLKGFVQPTLETIVATGILKTEGLVVIEHEKNDRWEVPEGLELVKSRTYGITTVTIYRRA